jgi:hypothetical protein
MSADPHVATTESFFARHFAQTPELAPPGYWGIEDEASVGDDGEGGEDGDEEPGGAEEGGGVAAEDAAAADAGSDEDDVEDMDTMDPSDVCRMRAGTIVFEDFNVVGTFEPTGLLFQQACAGAGL